jgi:phage-related minor tail protein
MRILEAIANALLMKAVVGPIAGALSGGFGGLFGSARGNVFEAGRVVPFARGGVLTRPIIFPMANGLGLAGEAGPEAIMPLRRLGNGRLGVESAGAREGASVQVNIINASGERVSERRTAQPGGGQRIDVMIGDMVRDLIRNDLAIGGEIDRSLRNRFGLTPKLA